MKYICGLCGKLIMIIGINVIIGIIIGVVSKICFNLIDFISYIVTWYVFIILTYYSMLYIMFKYGYKQSLYAGITIWLVISTVEKIVISNISDYLFIYRIMQILICLICIKKVDLVY